MQRVEQQKKAEEWERIPEHGEDGTGSIILRSASASLCVTEQWRGRLIFCGCLFCAYVLEEVREGGSEGGREASGEKREMKRMNVPLRKCHTGKICRF